MRYRGEYQEVHATVGSDYGKFMLARGQKYRIALTCASGEESPKDSLVRRFRVSKDLFAYKLVNFIHYMLCTVSCHIYIKN